MALGCPGFFADRALSRRIEAAEARFTLSCGQVVQRVRPACAAIASAIGGGAAVFSGEVSPFDKVIGIGFEPLDWAAFDEFEANVRSRGGTVQVELATRADSEVAQALTARGYRLVGFEDVLGVHLAGLEAARQASDIETRRVAPGELDGWIDAVVSGHAHSNEGDPAPHESFARDAIERVYRDLEKIDGFERYVAYRGGAIAGGASMRVDARIAQLTGAATLPAHRRRGVQTALTHTRLAEARRAGCEIAAVTTLPGSKSEENVSRLGFSVLYTRAVLSMP